MRRWIWTDEEDALLTRLWPKAPAHELQQAFPNHSMNALAHRACRLGVLRTLRENARSPLVLAWSSSGNARRGRGLTAPITVVDDEPGKSCRVCAKWLPLRHFTVHAGCAGGRRHICTTCEGRVARSSNPERTREATRRRAAAKRMADDGVSLRELSVLKRAFGGLCVYCGRSADTLDHVVPLAQGGRHSIRNLVPACGSCNSKKGNRTPEQWKSGAKAPQYRKKGI